MAGLLTPQTHLRLSGALSQITKATASLSTSSSSGRGLSERELKDGAQLAAYKKGPGYRSSFSGTVATVFGANGCIGRGVCNKLGKSGSQMILPYRGDHYDFLRLKVCGDLGQVLFSPFHLNDEESLRLAMRHSNVVINLIGREWGTKNFSLEDVNVKGPARLARIARECGVERFIHISALNAREKPRTVFLQNGSEWLRTKWLGEQAVLEEFPNATIFRPTEVYGHEDSFINHYFGLLYRAGGRSIQLWKRGEETIKIPLGMFDLASGIVNSLNDPNALGTTYEAYGPERYLLADLIDWMAAKTDRDPSDWGYKRTDLRFSPFFLAKTFVAQNLPVGLKHFGKLTFDKLERNSLSDEVLGLPNLEDLGVQLSTITEKMPFDLKVHKVYGNYIPDTIEEEPVIPDPVPISKAEERKVIRASKTPLLSNFGLS